MHDHWINAQYNHPITTSENTNNIALDFTEIKEHIYYSQKN